MNALEIARECQLQAGGWLQLAIPSHGAPTHEYPMEMAMGWAIQAEIVFRDALLELLGEVK